ncbi:MAG: EF-hand domain-containing protein [Syntrophaceae bacterium]|nr:EF-hand domain-containing protein [Syntrophaceae bacterium]
MTRRSRQAGIFLAVSLCLACPAVAPAQTMGPPDAVLREAYREILAQADKNGDGRLSMNECLAIWKDKQKGEKDCRYWDANGDGVITEDEYVKQVRKIMR